MFSFFATLPVGLNHPRLKDPAFLAKLTRAALVNPTNSDIYTVEMAEFVDTFGRVAMPPYLPHVFFVAGGTLGVENALKAAFDWKVRRNFRKGLTGGEGPPDPPLPRGVPRPLGLHAVADQHRRPAEVPVLPEVRLAAHRQPQAALPGRRRRARARRSRPSGRRSTRSRPPSASAATTSPASSSSRSRPRAATTTSAASSCARCAIAARERRAAHLRRGADRRRPHRPDVGAPALRRASPTCWPSARRCRCAA